MESDGKCLGSKPPHLKQISWTGEINELVKSVEFDEASL